MPNPRLRASDADRERIVEQLRQHTAEGRLTMDEFDQRMAAAYEAKTYGDLAELTGDLPVDLGAANRPGSGWTALRLHPPASGETSGVNPGTLPADVVGALVGAAMDWKMQKRRVRDEMRRQRYQARMERRRQRSAPQAVAGWVRLSIFLTGIWFLIGITTGGFGSFWPAWPIGIVGLLTLLEIIKGTVQRR
jgi:hypothetical protein